MGDHGTEKTSKKSDAEILIDHADRMWHAEVDNWYRYSKRGQLVVTSAATVLGLLGFAIFNANPFSQIEVDSPSDGFVIFLIFAFFSLIATLVSLGFLLYAIVEYMIHREEVVATHVKMNDAYRFGRGWDLRQPRTNSVNTNELLHDLRVFLKKNECSEAECRSACDQVKDRSKGLTKDFGSHNLVSDMSKDHPPNLVRSASYHMQFPRRFIENYLGVHEQQDGKSGGIWLLAPPRDGENGDCLVEGSPFSQITWRPFISTYYAAQELRSRCWDLYRRTKRCEYKFIIALVCIGAALTLFTIAQAIKGLSGIEQGSPGSVNIVVEGLDNSSTIDEGLDFQAREGVNKGGKNGN